MCGKWLRKGGLHKGNVFTYDGLGEPLCVPICRERETHRERRRRAKDSKGEGKRDTQRESRGEEEMIQP